MQRDYLTGLLGIQGYCVTRVEQIGKEPGRSFLRVHLERTRQGYICSGCGQGLLHGFHTRVLAKSPDESKPTR